MRMLPRCPGSAALRLPLPTAPWAAWPAKKKSTIILFAFPPPLVLQNVILLHSIYYMLPAMPMLGTIYDMLRTIRSTTYNEGKFENNCEDDGNNHDDDDDDYRTTPPPLILTPPTAVHLSQTPLELLHPLLLLLLQPPLPGLLLLLLHCNFFFFYYSFLLLPLQLQLQLQQQQQLLLLLLPATNY